MKEILEFLGRQEIIIQPVNRRTFLTGAAVAGLGMTALSLGLAPQALAQTTPQVPEIRSEKQFREIILGLGMVSLLTAHIGVEKATDPMPVSSKPNRLRSPRF